MSRICVLGVSSQDSDLSCICVLGVSSGTDTPNTQTYDISLSWLGTDTPNTNTWHLIVLTW
jgi:hypothetical protein